MVGFEKHSVCLKFISTEFTRILYQKEANIFLLKILVQVSVIREMDS